MYRYRESTQKTSAVYFKKSNVEYYERVKNCRQFSLLTWNWFIGQTLYTVGVEGMG